MVAETTQTAEARAARIIRSAFPDVDIPEVSITEFVLGEAAARGDKPAVVDGPSGRTLTFAQLVGAVRRAATGLTAHGFKKGDVLGIYSPNVPEYAVAFHAVASLGGIATTINPLYTVRELSQQLTDCNARFLLTVPPFMDNVRAAVADVPTVEEIFVFGEAEGATPFARLLTHGDQPPEVTISFVGERERFSLEPLLATPVATTAILLGKLIAAIVPAVLGTWIGVLVFWAMTLVSRSSIYPRLLLADGDWLFSLVVVTPLVALFTAAVAALISTRVAGYRVAYQLNGLIALPVVLLLLPIAAFGFLLTSAALGYVAVLFGLLDIVLCLWANGLFDRERLMSRR